jgi:hypothetical protein
MKDKQLEMLKSIVKELKSEHRTKEDALRTFVNAGILNKNGNFTRQYADLGKLYRPVR